LLKAFSTAVRVRANEDDLFNDGVIHFAKEPGESEEGEASFPALGENPSPLDNETAGRL